MATSADLAGYRTTSADLGRVRISVLRLPSGASGFEPRRGDEARIRLVLPVDGGVVVRARSGQQHLVGRQDIAWMPSWTPVVLSVVDPTSIVVVELPGDEFVRHGVPIGSVPPRTHPSSPLVRPVREFFLAAAENIMAVEPISAHLFERMAGELAESLALEARGMPSAKARIRPPLHDQAVAHITAFRSSPDLNPQQVAKSLRVSVRQLQRVFEEAGTTVAGEIRRQRTAAAIAMLSNDEYDELKMPEIAARAGFRNDAEMRRAVATWMGTTPSRLRDHRGSLAG
jgi:AraC-like DNA-binding protein